MSLVITELENRVRAVLAACTPLSSGSGVSVMRGIHHVVSGRSGVCSVTGPMGRARVRSVAKLVMTPQALALPPAWPWSTITSPVGSARDEMHPASPVCDA